MLVLEDGHDARIHIIECLEPGRVAVFDQDHIVFGEPQEGDVLGHGVGSDHGRGELLKDEPKGCRQDSATVSNSGEIRN